MFLNVFDVSNLWGGGGGERCLKFREKGKILGLGVVKDWNMKWIISRQLPDSPPPQQGASDPISALTGLCVYLFYPHIYPSQINIFFPKF